MNLYYRLLLVSVLVLSACATIIPKEYLIPKDQMVGTLQKQFPLHWDKGAGLLGIAIDQPQLTLLPEQNRVRLHGRFLAHVPLLDIEGAFDCSSALHYDPTLRAVLLQGVSLDALQLKQGKNLTERLRSEISRIMNSYAADHPLYRFKPDELAVLGVSLDVDGIVVTPDGIVLKLRAKQ